MILLRVGVGDGALRAPEILRELRGAGHRVEVVLDEGAEAFVGPAPFAGHLRRPDDASGDGAEVIVYAPATAGTLARLSHGMGETPAAGRAAVVAPELDERTARHPAVVENISRLREDGFRVIAGADGQMAATGEVVAAALGSLGGPLAGVRVLVTAGGTREPMDTVRFIGNRSSGKMGRAIAREAVRMGAEVTVVAAAVSDPEPGTRWVDVETVDELEGAVLDAAAEADALIMAAAVSDFKPAERLEGKIRRGDELRVAFRPTADVLKAVTGTYPDLYVVGFAATHGDPVEDAREKLGKKGVDLVVGNDVSGEGVGFGSDWNEVHLVSRQDERFVPRTTKDEIARIILEHVAREAQKKRGGVGP